MAVMHLFKAAQPALLYLSPACILSVLIVALVRGELSDVFSYEHSTEDKNDKKKTN
jgi:minor histocompatibility antigen H13